MEMQAGGKSEERREHGGAVLFVLFGGALLRFEMRYVSARLHPSLQNVEQKIDRLLLNLIFRNKDDSTARRGRFFRF